VRGMYGLGIAKSRRGSEFPTLASIVARWRLPVTPSPRRRRHSAQDWHGLPWRMDLRARRLGQQPLRLARIVAHAAIPLVVEILARTRWPGSSWPPGRGAACGRPRSRPSARLCRKAAPCRTASCLRRFRPPRFAHPLRRFGADRDEGKAQAWRRCCLAPRAARAAALPAHSCVRRSRQWVFSQATNIDKLRKRVTALANDATCGLDDAAVRAMAERDRVSTKIAAPPPPALDSLDAGYEQEIWATLRGLTDKERQARLRMP
jgi:hypothetical protein